ncbi:MAG: hypothetical protein E7160_01915 [Firmicutes bacterium]|nr:hypothetical protein [Bacillota bacterium]
MEKGIKKLFKSSIVTSIVLLILGALLVFESERTIVTISYVLGGILVGIGGIAIIDFIKKATSEPGKYNLDIIYGVSSIILGILIITNPHAIASIIPIVIGLSIIVISCTKLQYAFGLKESGNEIWKATMIISTISIICGMVLLFNPFKVAVGITKIAGVFIIIYAILDLSSTIALKLNINAKEEKIVEAKVIEEKTKPKKEKKTKKKDDNK